MLWAWEAVLRRVADHGSWVGSTLHSEHEGGAMWRCLQTQAIRGGGPGSSQPRLETLMALAAGRPGPGGGVTLVTTACPAECCSHEWGVGVGCSQGWADVLVDLMRNPVEQQNF